LERGTFVTLWCGILDPATGRLTHASAGHLPLLVYRAGRGTTEWHRSSGVPVGAVGSHALRRTVRDEVLPLHPGDMIVQLTDGFTEAPAGGDGEMFGFDRLADTVLHEAGRGPQGVVEALGGAVEAWRGHPVPHDDETVLVVALDGVTALPEIESAEPSTPEQALCLLQEAERAGSCLRLPARLDELVRLRGWILEIPAAARLTGRQTRMLESALYEACANAIEHACDLDPSMDVELWWSPPGSSQAVHEGRFLLVDHGRSFDPAERTRPDPHDEKSRRRGRGFGLEMIHRLMSRVAYFARTSRGNLMVMRFDPGRMT
jgi:anti-sigma regulatory factor (Ser/Thr protein kinase)